jgi:hypothetical protein
VSDLVTISKDEFKSMLQEAVQKGIQAERGRMTDMWMNEWDFRVQWGANGKPLSKGALNAWIVKYGFTTRQLGDRRQILRSSVERALKGGVINQLKKSA